MSVISMKALLESGVHFGHRPHRWNPKMKPYIFTERNGIHIIDLQKTVKGIDQAFALVRDAVEEGGTVLFVGTKRQAQETIQNEAVRCGMPYVTNRWLGGMLTNWRTIRARVNELERLERMRDQGDFASLTKKEALILSRKIERLEMLLGGIRDLAKVPDVLFVVDVHREDTAIHEANLLEIPVVAMVDTNCDPSSIDYVIPSNDDAIRAIRLIVAKIADAVLEGKAMRKEEDMDDVAVSSSSLVDETELSDEDLLGEATLAKISSGESSEEDSADDEIEAVISEEELESESDEDEEESSDEAESEEESSDEAESEEESSDEAESEEE